MADLYVRWTPTAVDVGDRPISPCWPPNAVWTNASIWMSYPPSHPDPAKRGMTALQARVGETVMINVAAYTRSATFPFPPDQEFVRCQIWACTGANGVGPISALDSAGGSPGMTAIVLGTIDTGFPGVATALWTPAGTDDLVFDAAGAAHVCLAANLVFPATASGQGQYLPQFVSAGQPVRTVFPCGDGPLDPRSNVPIGHFQGQKNIQVLSADAAELVSSLRLVAGGARREQRVLQVVERPAEKLAAIVGEHLLADDAVVLAGGKPRPPRAVELDPPALEPLEPGLREVLAPAGRILAEPIERAQLAGGGRLMLADREGVELRLSRRPLDPAAIRVGDARGGTVELDVDPHEPREVVVDLRAAGRDRPGTVRIFDVAERDERKRLIGGTTIVTLARDRSAA